MDRLIDWRLSWDVKLRPWGSLEKCNVRNGPGSWRYLPWVGEDLKKAWFCVVQTFGMLPWRRGNGFILRDSRSKNWNHLYFAIRYISMFTFEIGSCARKKKWAGCQVWSECLSPVATGQKRLPSLGERLPAGPRNMWFRGSEFWNYSSLIVGHQGF